MKKNRFYYSFDQECIARQLGDWDEIMLRIEAVRENYVLTPNGYRKYTQWCSTPGSKCNWDDAELVFETDDDPKIKITYRKTSQLQALEDENAKLRKQLAEKDKENATLEAMLAENKNEIKEMQEFEIGEYQYDLTDEDARYSLKCELLHKDQDKIELLSTVRDKIFAKCFDASGKGVVCRYWDINEIIGNILKQLKGEQ